MFRILGGVMQHTWRILLTKETDEWEFVWRCDKCAMRFTDIRPKDDILAREHSTELMSRDIADCKGVWVKENHHPNRVQEP
jgi:hypothetical protein